MAGFQQKRPMAPRRDEVEDAVPEEIVRALDASAEDLVDGRIHDDFDGLINEMEAELEVHLARKRAARS